MENSRFSLSSLYSEVFRRENVSDQEMRPDTCLGSSLVLVERKKEVSGESAAWV